MPWSMRFPKLRVIAASSAFILALAALLPVSSASAAGPETAMTKFDCGWVDKPAAPNPTHTFRPIATIQRTASTGFNDNVRVYMQIYQGTTLLAQLSNGSIQSDGTVKIGLVPLSVGDSARFTLFQASYSSATDGRAYDFGFGDQLLHTADPTIVHYGGPPVFPNAEYTITVHVVDLDGNGDLIVSKTCPARNKYLKTGCIRNVAVAIMADGKFGNPKKAADAKPNGCWSFFRPGKHDSPSDGFGERWTQCGNKGTTNAVLGNVEWYYEEVVRDGGDASRISACAGYAVQGSNPTVPITSTIGVVDMTPPAAGCSPCNWIDAGSLNAVVSNARQYALYAELYTSANYGYPRLADWSANKTGHPLISLGPYGPKPPTLTTAAQIESTVYAFCHDELPSTGDPNFGIYGGSGEIFNDTYDPSQHRLSAVVKALNRCTTSA